MLADRAHLSLLLDAPLQSWGLASRFQRRTTELHPTKSGVIGLVCAAMGLAKGSLEERQALPKLAALKMINIAIPRQQVSRWKDKTGELPVRRLGDFHTTGGGYGKKMQSQFIPRKASGGPCDNPTVSHRQYLNDASFGVILSGDRPLLEEVAAALQDPVWGVWFGRKSCIPAEPIYRGLYAHQDEAQRELIKDRPIEQFTLVTEVIRFEDGTDSLSDQPICFGDDSSSGPDKRKFAVRRVLIRPRAVFPSMD